MIASHATEVLNHSNTVLPQESQLCIVKGGAMKFRTIKIYPDDLLKCFMSTFTHKNLHKRLCIVLEPQMLQSPQSTILISPQREVTKINL